MMFAKVETDGKLGRPITVFKESCEIKYLCMNSYPLAILLVLTFDFGFPVLRVIEDNAEL